MGERRLLIHARAMIWTKENMNKSRLLKLYEDHRGKVSDKWSIYFAEYDRLLDRYVDAPVRLLEIGIQNGGSLEIWSKYFSDARRIVGCDINPDCRKLTYEDSRISVIVGDANTDETQQEILSLVSEFDVVIDDGSHSSGDIVRSFARYFRHLADGGIYVAEDLHCSYWQAYEGGLFDPKSSVSFFKRLADVVSHEHWGIERSRRDILAGFLDTYGVDITEEVLRHVHSVEFINSMCVVRKEPPQANVIGHRFIAGTSALVYDGLGSLHMNPHPPAHEEANPWSSNSWLPEDELVALRAESANLRAEVDALRMVGSKLERSLQNANHSKEALLARVSELEVESRRVAQLAASRFDMKDVATRIEAAIAPYKLEQQAVKDSTSWRVTAPVRWLGDQVRTARRAKRLLPVAVQQHDGVVGASRWFLGTLMKSGINGVRSAAYGLERASGLPPEGAESGTEYSYAEWVRRYDTLDDIDRARLRTAAAEMPRSPLISIVMPTYNANFTWINAAIESVRNQIYTKWELCIADDASTVVEVRDLLTTWAESDSRIKVVFRPQNGHISAASNSAIELASGEWVALMDHDDLLPEHALFWVAECINSHPDVRLIYSDEDKIDEQGIRLDPYFKSDWNIDLFYSQNMFSHLGVFEASLLRAVGGFRVGMEGSQDYDLVLRCIEHVDAAQICHIPKVLYHWRVHAQSTASSTDAKPYAQLAGERALNEHFQRREIKGRVEYVGNGYRARYELPLPLPLVSLIIPTRNAMELVRQCVDSIVSRTTYGNYEIVLVDNGSDNPQALEYFASLADRPKFRVIRDEREFNYSALNNMAVASTQGDYVALINNDIEVISPDWLSDMVAIASQPGVGAVGARLWYPDETLQHGGVVLGIGGVAGHSHKRLPRGHGGSFERAALIQSFSAVTAACLVVSRRNYELVDGLNETDLKVAFNDVDFCLRLREAGLRNVWTPYAELFHHESATRGDDSHPEKQRRFASEVHYMLARWGRMLRHDPAYNPNLTLLHEDFSLAWPPLGVEDRI
jgi:glycosyltransferase involved in cell wall biosynthesis